LKKLDRSFAKGYLPPTEDQDTHSTYSRKRLSQSLHNVNIHLSFPLNGDDKRKEEMPTIGRMNVRWSLDLTAQNKETRTPSEFASALAVKYGLSPKTQLDIEHDIRKQLSLHVYSNGNVIDMIPCVTLKDAIGDERELNSLVS